jgi:hypothetical protein
MPSLQPPERVDPRAEFRTRETAFSFVTVDPCSNAAALSRAVVGVSIEHAFDEGERIKM